MPSLQLSRPPLCLYGGSWGHSTSVFAEIEMLRYFVLYDRNSGPPVLLSLDPKTFLRSSRTLPDFLWTTTETEQLSTEGGGVSLGALSFCLSFPAFS